ncbi:hypothetical protein F5883DRAFT_567867 [Diaporthe sp. PMI_573]|nr:hypothetical protein F5883DRAFT_567867 [Diaporthaceae sp. PMI_573]
MHDFSVAAVIIIHIGVALPTPRCHLKRLAGWLCTSVPHGSGCRCAGGSHATRAATRNRVLSAVVRVRVLDSRTRLFTIVSPACHSGFEFVVLSREDYIYQLKLVLARPNFYSRLGSWPSAEIVYGIRLDVGQLLFVLHRRPC